MYKLTDKLPRLKVPLNKIIKHFSTCILLKTRKLNRTFTHYYGRMNAAAEFVKVTLYRF